jgi:carboxypeptidase Taq
LSLYDTFIEKVREIKNLQSVNSLLEWDQETMMPPKGIEYRAAQIALISGMVHQKLTSDEFGELLDKLSSPSELDGLDELKKANVREMRREFDKARKLPTDLVKEIAETASLSQNAWVRARRESKFGDFSPWLTKMLKLKTQAARLIGYKEHIYDALLDDYEPGATVGKIKVILGDLKDGLVLLIREVLNSKAALDDSILHRDYDVAKQKEFGTKVLQDMGFDFEAGRIDISAHPFCTSFAPGDVRVTTRYGTNDLKMALFGMIHEAGHALYEQGLSPQHHHTPMADAISLGIHESQSRLWENMIGRSRLFWQHYFPKAKETFAESLSGLGLEDFYRAINRVTPSFIRVEADELTYNIHILIRFEIEAGLFEEAIQVDDLPKVWNRKMEEYLGITPPNDREGVLQDIHWALGLFGYFPTYTLGNLYAAQFLGRAEKDIADFWGKVSRGQFSDLKSWLNTNIHRHGRLYSADDLVRRVTGETLNAKHFLGYLRSKFGDLYRLSS